VAVFAIALLLTSACGGSLVWGRLRERVGRAARRPFASAFLGFVLLVVILPSLGFLAVVFLHTSLPLFLVLLFLTPFLIGLLLSLVLPL
jgi:hypothetical protein